VTPRHRWFISRDAAPRSHPDQMLPRQRTAPPGFTALGIRRLTRPRTRRGEIEIRTGVLRFVNDGAIDARGGDTTRARGPARARLRCRPPRSGAVHHGHALGDGADDPGIRAHERHCHRVDFLVASRIRGGECQLASLRRL
jgi:hypothetical protein